MYIGIAETEEEKRAVYRLRYDVYVEEMGRYQTVADHAQRMLYEEVDKQSRISYASIDGEVVATARLTWGGDGAFPQRMIDQYGLAPFLEELPADAIAVGERAMVRPHLRGTDLLFKIMIAGRDWISERRIQLIFGDCEPHLLNLYLSLGQRTYSKRNINSPEAGYLIPIVTVVEDVDYLRQINSPMAEYACDFGADARIPDIIKRTFAEGSAVVSRAQTTSASYWSDVHGALSELENRISALDGFTEAEAARCLEKSTIIECAAGDRVLKKGGVARNLFVVLDGTLEVRDGDVVQAVFTRGDVFGEMAFLLERPRTADVYAATDDVRILSLSEAQLKKMTKSDPEIAARLLLNISKMLCLRILKTG
jgi:hypothetical protein